ncbi:MAG: adenosine kinase [Deltaproteobacteria bacterium]|nr:adenosine kinase [Deltaproteobacteria bacterium]
MKKKPILCVGGALIDILLNEEDDFLKQTIGSKGGMHLVEPEIIKKYLSISQSVSATAPGGSACNTAVGIGRLGGDARFVGKSGVGKNGLFFENQLKNSAVSPYLIKSASPTGRVLSIITPDAERTMFTYLGASATITPEEIEDRFFKDIYLVHIEGYLLFNPDIMAAVLKKAKKFKAFISLDLASYTVVEESKNLLRDIVEEYVDILIANEEEAKAYTGFSDENKAITALANKAKIAILKVGEKGSYIANNNEIIRIAPASGKVKASDTTGAGDLWASGFLFGLTNGFGLKKSGELGSLCGYEVCKVIGAHVPEDRWEYIRSGL